MSTGTLMSDYRIWHHLQVASGDIDPVYPVLRKALSGASVDEMVWGVFLHVAWYHPGSTFAALKLWPSPEMPIPDAVLALPCGTERRGHRSTGALVKHLTDLRKRFSGWLAPSLWLMDLTLGQDPYSGWEALNEELMSFKGNGRWAAYKTAEMLQKVVGAQVIATDAGHAFSTGPRHGLELLFPDCPGGNTKDDIRRLDTLTDDLSVLLGEPDIAQVETTLCDFHSMVKGRYYTGHDIDGMQEALRDPRVESYIGPEVWEARAASFAPEYLGELNNWTGVRKDLNTRYARTGEFL